MWVVWSGSLYIGLVRFIGSLHPCNMTADWSPFSSRFNWLVFMHTNMSCQLIGPCCPQCYLIGQFFCRLPTVIHTCTASWLVSFASQSDWSTFLQTWHNYPCMQYTMYHLTGQQLCFSMLSDWSIFLQTKTFNIWSDWSALLYFQC